MWLPNSLVLVLVHQITFISMAKPKPNQAQLKHQDNFDPFGYVIDSEPCRPNSRGQLDCVQACGQATQCREYFLDPKTKENSLPVCKCEDQIRFNSGLKSQHCGFVNWTRVLMEDFGMNTTSPETSCTNHQELAYQKCGLQCEVMRDDSEGPEGLYHGFLCLKSTDEKDGDPSLSSTYSCECIKRGQLKVEPDMDTYGLNDACPYARFSFFPQVESSKDPADSVVFRLYTNQNNPEEFQIIRLNNQASLFNSKYKLMRDLKILIHGYRSGPTHLYPQNVKNEYLNAKPPKNVLIVDWEHLARLTQAFVIGSYYRASVINVPIVGQRVGEMIEFLIRNGKTQLDKVHIQGHSLGAHVAGVAGNFLRGKYQNGKVARISGLDPAGPHFYSRLGMGRSLRVGDARFVDVIHTDQYLWGRAGRIGNADFIPDGGILVQENCRQNITNILLDIILLGSCSHSTAHILFSNSIGRWDIRACRCPNYILYLNGRCPCSKGSKDEAIFGDNCGPMARGNYFLHFKPCMEYSWAVCN